MPKRLEGKVAVVTGCGSSGPGWGNGKAIAALFAREGASVFGCDVNLGAAEETREIIQQEGGEATVVQCDVSDPTQVELLVAGCVKRYGAPAVLVNNVGIVTMGGPVEADLAEWRRSMDVNVTSMFLTCKYAIPHMEKDGGSIVNIGSIVGIRYSGVPYISYYASKAATIGLSRAVALQYAKKKIRSNVLMPGLMNTPMIVEPLKDVYESIESMIEKRNAQCPMGKMGDAWDVANAALWLASDESKYVTGTEIIVDGGLTARFA